MGSVSTAALTLKISLEFKQ